MGKTSLVTRVLKEKRDWTGSDLSEELWCSSMFVVSRCVEFASVSMKCLLPGATGKTRALPSEADPSCLRTSEQLADNDVVKMEQAHSSQQIPFWL